MYTIEFQDNRWIIYKGKEIVASGAGDLREALGVAEQLEVEICSVC